MVSFRSFTFDFYALSRVFLACLVLACIAVACLFGALNLMLKNDAQMSGKSWSRFIEKNLKSFDHILICEVPAHVGSHFENPKTTRFFKDIFSVGVVFHADIYDAAGVRKFHAGTYGQPESISSHSHENHKTRAVDALKPSHSTHMPSASKIRIPVANSTSSPATMSPASADFSLLHFPERRQQVQKVLKSQNQSVGIRNGDGKRYPSHYAVVHHPVFHDGELVSVIRLFVDLDERYWEHLQVIAVILGIASLFFGISFGAPMVRLVILSRKKSEADAKAHYLARHDSLTGLRNRRSFLSEAKNVHDESSVGGASYAVHYLDLDHFKQANDTLGHSVGDDLLCEAALRIWDALGEDTLVARMGGDEFAILQVGIETADDAAEHGRRIVEAFRPKFHINGQELPVTASIGTALFPKDDDALDAVIAKADKALYWVKRNERGTNACYAPDMENDLLHREKVEAQIRQALVEDGFELYFQPQISLLSGRVSGFEALVRMCGPDGEIVPPDEFIPIAEESELICDIGNWVLRRAVQVASHWPDHLSVAVNVSPAQFGQGEFLGTVAAALAEYDFDPHRLEIEITEGLLFEDTDRNSELLKEIGALGVSLSMDDFGTGYSSLSYLWRLPIDKIKIDRSFMRQQSEGDSNTVVILRAIIEMGHRMGMTVVAEGVETVEQVCLVKSLNCDFIQGYFYSRPIPETDVAVYLLKNFSSEEPSEKQRPAQRITNRG